jgi:hypothetical protein
MTMTSLNLRPLEGHRVSFALADGSRIDDCELISAPRMHSARVWICVSGMDVFLPLASIRDVWESRPVSARHVA